MNAVRTARRTPALNPALYLARIVMGVVLTVALYALCRPPIPALFAIVGAMLGILAGFIQHIHLKRDYNRFGAAASLIEIQRRLTEARAASAYRMCSGATVLGLVLLSFALNQSPITAAAACAAALLLFSSAHDALTLRDARAMTK